MDSISIYAECIDDVSVVGQSQIEITISGVDVGNVVQEFDLHDVLEAVGEDTVREWLEERDGSDV